MLVLVDIDALKRSEQVAAAAQELAENTVETVREPLVVLDHQLHIERANRAFYRHFRCVPAETVGQFIYEVNNRQWDIPSLRELFDEILPRRITIEDFLVEHEFDHVGFRSMLLNARRIEDPRHKTARILLAIEDITERKQVEISSARLAAIVESSDDAIFGKDLRGILISWNQGAQRLFGYTPQEAMGQSAAILTPPDRPGEEAHMLERIKRGESTNHCQTVRRRKDGTLVHVSLTVSPIKNAQGELIGASEIARDISERELLEAAMRQNEALFSTILEQAPVGMYIVDAQFRGNKLTSSYFRSASSAMYLASFS